MQIEVDNDAELKTALFEDTKMQELVLSYLNALDAQIDVIDSYQYESYDYIVAWEKVYNQRSSILKDMADTYGLTVGESYQEAFNDIVRNGKAVQQKTAAEEAINGLLESATWEPVDDGYCHYYMYQAIIEKTTEYDFKNVSINVGFYDADDVRTESYANAQSWKKGDKVKFEAYSGEVEAQRIEATVEYYEIAE